MYPSLQLKLDRFEDLERMLQDPDVLSNPMKAVELQREYGGLRKTAESVRNFKQLEDDLAAAKEFLSEATDDETREYAQAEVASLSTKKSALQSELEDLVTAGDSITRGGLIMEIRAGTGGDEAALFAGDLYNMYLRYIDIQGWKSEIMDIAEGEMGGYKEIVFSVSGEGAYHKLQFESGGHRVQRVPATESQGRIHTSAATVAVLPEVTDVEIVIKEEDLQIDTMRAGGPGGQKVNKTESAVRITHIPTGIVVKCQDEKSQHKNKAQAMRVLRSRMFEEQQKKENEARASTRRTLIGSGDRSEKIRTYNYPQARVTDHRINHSIYKLQAFMMGEINEMVDALVEFDRQERLKMVHQ